MNFYWFFFSKIVEPLFRHSNAYRKIYDGVNCLILVIIVAAFAIALFITRLNIKPSLSQTSAMKKTSCYIIILYLLPSLAMAQTLLPLYKDSIPNIKDEETVVINDGAQVISKVSTCRIECICAKRTWLWLTLKKSQRTVDGTLPKLAGCHRMADKKIV